MRVLFLSPTLPWPLDSGGRIRTFQLLRGVSALHEVHLWAVRQPEVGEDEARRVAEVCQDVRSFERTPMPVPRHWIAPAQESWFHSAPFEEAVAEAYASEEFDLVHIDEMCLTRSVLELSGPNEVLHHHKLDVDLVRGLHLAGRATLVETIRWRALEELAAARFAQHVFCTQHDADLFSERHPRITPHVVPNGVDPEYFKDQGRERDPHELLFLGSLDYEPNLDGLERFLAGVWPALRERVPDVSLVVVGRAPSDELRQSLPPGVHLIADVDDVRPYLARAAALIVPLEIGGGSRLKIAEALAMGCPVISTKVGAEGFASELLHVVPQIQDLLQAVMDRHARSAASVAELPLRSWSELAVSLGAAWSSATAR